MHVYLIVRIVSLFVTHAYCCIALLKYLAEAMSLLLHLMDNYYYFYCWFEIYIKGIIFFGVKQRACPDRD